MRILITDPLSDEGVRLLRQEKGVTVDVKTDLKAEEIRKVIGGYDGLLVRSGTQVTREILESAGKLKVIGRAGAGLDNIDVEAASKRGVIVMNAAGGNTISTAEHTMSMILSLVRNIPQANASLRKGEWKRSSFTGVELYGKTLGIVGLGRVGSEVARRALGFGMRLMVFDPYLTADKARELDAHPVADLNEIFEKADIITIHTPMTEATRGLIGAKELARMKKGVRIVNCARGGIVEEKALADAIESGHVAGAALDVFVEEPPKDRRLVDLPQVVSTPHLGASTKEAQLNVATEIAMSVRDYLLGRGVRNAVNIPSIDPEALKLVEPYLKLAERMGALQAQMLNGPMREVRVRYIGELVKLDLATVTLAFLKGLLTPVLQETVNYVNAAVIAKERGIKVIESKSAEAEDFANLIVATVKADGQEAQLQGTLFTRSDPRIVQIDDIRVEAIPDGWMLVVRNDDKPGMVGQFGTILGDHGINIGWMNFGRNRPGGQALMAFNVDQPVPKELLAKIRKLPHVLDARLIKF
ncbi:MAG: phosphoglycerate dehydrogenase [Candidatus Omnitrophica bacterium CG11_big_fil_rev_8_21_14_0_20_64_10]|nr:MAG: phosphoglycerate dehydrogenase [Candidatus Omnitrophica bacterium CG11_big_fil_rev_8_21_14_0_20_64_10]